MAEVIFVAVLVFCAIAILCAGIAAVIVFIRWLVTGRW